MSALTRKTIAQSLTEPALNSCWQIAWHVLLKLHANELIVGDGQMRKRYILCFKPEKGKRQRKHRDRVLEILKEELARHPGNKKGIRGRYHVLDKDELLSLPPELRTGGDG